MSLLIQMLDEVPAELGKSKLGGKGLELVEMLRLEMPVPPGFILTTGVSRAYMQNQQLPNRIGWQLNRAVHLLEKKTNSALGDPENPLLVSVRSGSPISMPGMMDTVLNVGVTKRNLEAIGKKYGEDFAWDIYLRFLRSYAIGVFGIDKSNFSAEIPEDLNEKQSLAKMFEKKIRQSKNAIPFDPIDQLISAIKAVISSFNSERAKAYRAENSISDTIGTAVIVQMMVYGNADEKSGTGVLFSRNINNGAKQLYGEFLPKAQGNDVVDGSSKVMPIGKLRQLMPANFNQLSDTALKLERITKDVVDIEFTIESGTLYTLQKRRAKRSSGAAIKIACDMLDEGLIEPKDIQGRFSFKDLNCATKELCNCNTCKAALETYPQVKGLSASPGAVCGPVVFDLKGLKLYKSSAPILVKEETSPDDFMAMIESKGIVTTKGGTSCHAALTARQMGIPCVVSAQLEIRTDTKGQYIEIGGKRIKEGDNITLDATRGKVYLDIINVVQPKMTELETLRLKSLMTGYKFDRSSMIRLDSAMFHRGVFHDLLQLTLNFYLSEALCHFPKTEKKAEMIYSATTRNLSSLFLTYLVAAIAGELRHAHQKIANQKLSKNDRTALEGFGVTLINRLNVERSTVQSNALRAIRHENQAIDFLKLASRIFGEYMWEGSYGGERWQVIAETVLMFVTERIPAEVFVDRVYDLQHNGGCVFDKHEAISTLLNSHSLMGFLDLKRNYSDQVFLRETLNRFTVDDPEILNLIHIALRKKGGE